MCVDLTEGRTVILHTEVEYSYIFIKLWKADGSEEAKNMLWIS
jgi:hypothetical protein